jgi:hypothetical protein
MELLSWPANQEDPTMKSPKTVKRRLPKRPPNYHMPYSDEELVVILSDASTQANAIKHALRFQRTFDAIEMIYKWAMTPKSTIEERGQADHAFILQIRKVAKQRVGWLS